MCNLCIQFKCNRGMFYSCLSNYSISIHPHTQGWIGNLYSLMCSFEAGVALESPLKRLWNLTRKAIASLFEIAYLTFNNLAVDSTQSRFCII